jgi:uncharacterized cupredoxin-like copper-binding protein
MQKHTHALVAALLATASALAWAHGDTTHAKAAGPAKMEQKAWGIAGNPKKVNRTITFTMTDAMRFDPSQITVKQGDTIRFVIKNGGGMLHEMVIGTPKDLDEHAALMLKFPNMEHDEPYMAHVGAGQTSEIVWNFNQAGSFDFACLIAGHYQAGMRGKITVAAK